LFKSRVPRRFNRISSARRCLRAAILLAVISLTGQAQVRALKNAFVRPYQDRPVPRPDFRNLTVAREYRSDMLPKLSRAPS
jgi:hypothetical protein